MTYKDWLYGIKPAPKDGRCCDCGYHGQEETECPKREDKTHCVHWWDGSNTQEEDR